MNTFGFSPHRWHAIRNVVVGLSLFTGLVAAAPAWAGGGKGPTDKPAYSAVVVFGDSLSDTGRAASVLGEAAPISMINGRLSNGPLWIEYVSPVLGLPYNPLNNYSWAGAFTDRGNAFTGLPGVLDELDEFLAPYGERKHIPKDALYVVFAGSNDFLKILSGAASPVDVIPAAVHNLVTVITTLQARGAKHIVVMDLPDVGLTPRARLAGPAAAAQATALSVYFNTLFEAALDALKFEVIRVSAFAALHEVVANPSAYGFTNTTDIGILDPLNSGTYVFWDDVHPTTRVHAILAAEVLEAVREAVEDGGVPWRGAQGFFWRRAP